MKIYLFIPIILLSLLWLLPANTSKDNSVTVFGTLVAVEEGGTKDAGLSLLDDDRSFYINRGLEQGLTLPALRSYIGKPVSIMYARHWLNFIGYGGYHITELRCGDRVIYSGFSDGE